MANVLGELGNLASMGPDMILQVLGTVVNAIGEGTEWTGDQIAQLGQLESQLAQKVQALGGGGGGGTGAMTTAAPGGAAGQQAAGAPQQPQQGGQPGGGSGQ